MFVLLVFRESSRLVAGYYRANQENGDFANL